MQSIMISHSQPFTYQNSKRKIKDLSAFKLFGESHLRQASVPRFTLEIDLIRLIEFLNEPMPLLRVPLRPFRHRNVRPAVSGYRRKQSEKIGARHEKLTSRPFSRLRFQPHVRGCRVYPRNCDHRLRFIFWPHPLARRTNGAPARTAPASYKRIGHKAPGAMAASPIAQAAGRLMRSAPAARS